MLFSDFFCKNCFFNGKSYLGHRQIHCKIKNAIFKNDYSNFEFYIFNFLLRCILRIFVIYFS